MVTLGGGSWDWGKVGWGKRWEVLLTCRLTFVASLHNGNQSNHSNEALGVHCFSTSCAQIDYKHS